MSSDSSSSFVDILVTSSINTFGTQRRFPTDIRISDLKQKLELLTGASTGTMELWLLDENNKLLSKLTDDSAVFGSYDLTNAKNLHVVDSFHSAGEFEDLSKVQKFELSDEEYSKRGETFRAFKEKLKIQNDDKENVTKAKNLEEEKLIETMTVGSRCEVHSAGKPSRRGTVMFAGKTDFKPGFWVGVKYDEPVGKNDGSVAGKRYFECQLKYGSFVKPHDVTIGNFPEESKELDEL